MGRGPFPAAREAEQQPQLSAGALPPLRARVPSPAWGHPGPSRPMSPVQCRACSPTAAAVLSPVWGQPVLGPCPLRAGVRALVPPQHGDSPSLQGLVSPLPCGNSWSPRPVSPQDSRPPSSTETSPSSQGSCPIKARVSSGLLSPLQHSPSPGLVSPRSPCARSPQARPPLTPGPSRCGPAPPQPARARSRHGRAGARGHFEAAPSPC